MHLKLDCCCLETFPQIALCLKYADSLIQVEVNLHRVIYLFIYLIYSWLASLPKGMATSNAERQMSGPHQAMLPSGGDECKVADDHQAGKVTGTLTSEFNSVA